jgi:transposase
MINALRGHLAEYGLVVRKGAENAPKLVELIRNPASELPHEARSVLEVLAQMLLVVEDKIAVLDAEIAGRARTSPLIKRLMTIPGIGAITATALAALAPAPETFRRGRDFAAWIGLTPLQKSSGGKERLGKVSKMGERTLRRLLIIGASSAAKAAARKGATPETWLGRMLLRKPRMLVAVALANKIARIAWALMAHGGTYRASAAAA